MEQKIEENYIIQPISLNDVTLLDDLFDSIKYIHQYVDPNWKKNALESILNPNFPKNGVKENLRHLCVYDTNKNFIINYIDCYIHFRNKKIAYK